MGYCTLSEQAKNQGENTIATAKPKNPITGYPEIRVIDAAGAQVGIITPSEALQLAAEAGLDLVMVNEDAQPPVCRIMDYGKYRFEAEKRARESRRKTRIADLKEVKMRYKIGEHDYQVRVNQARTFITSGDRVKAVITLRGREIEHPTLGFDLLNRMIKDLAEIGDLQQSPKKEGRNITMIMIPKKTG